MEIVSCIKRLFVCLLLVLTVFLISYPQNVSAEVLNNSSTGTGENSSIYQNMQNDSAKSAFEDLGDISSNVSNSWVNQLYKIHRGLSSVGPFVMIFSFVAGCFVVILARKNKGMKRFGLFGLCIGVLLVCLLFIFGLGILFGMFNH